MSNKVYLVKISDWESDGILSVWSTNELAEAEISRLRKKKYKGRLLYPKSGDVGLEVDIFEVDDPEGYRYADT